MAVGNLRTKDLLGIESLTPDEITLLLDTAESMRAIGQRSTLSAGQAFIVDEPAALTSLPCRNGWSLGGGLAPTVLARRQRVANVRSRAG